MIVSMEGLKEIRKENAEKKIVLGLGTFDLFHYEHLRYLIDAKKQGDILVVALKPNNKAKIKEASRPIIDGVQRAEIVDALKCVDYTVLIDSTTEQKQLPKELDIKDKQTKDWLCLFYQVFENLKPDILYHENTAHLQYGREQMSKMFGTKLVERERTAIVSTSKIINKIREINS